MGTTIADAVDSYYKGGGYLSRMKRFYEDRFGNAGNAKAIAKDMLMPDDAMIVNSGRIWLIQSTGGIPTLMPRLLPDGTLDEFCQGFADMLLDRVDQENARTVRGRGMSTAI